MAPSSKAERLARKFKTKLENLGCPLTEGVDERWVAELIFHPGEHRTRLLQWLFACFDSHLNDILDPMHVSADTKMDSRIQRLLFVASSLGLCSPNDVDLIRGNTSASRQVVFMDRLLDLVCIMDASRDSMALCMSSPGRVSSAMCLEEQFAQDVTFMERLALEDKVDSLCVTEAKLLPADIAKQVGLLAAPHDKEKISANVPQMSTLEEQTAKFAEDLQRQLDVLEELKKKHTLPDHDAAKREKVQRTLKLILSETSQIVVGFSYCFENEMKQWCQRSPPETNDLGPTFKRVHGVMQNFTSLLENIGMIKHSYSEMCSKKSMIQNISDKGTKKKNASQTQSAIESLQEFIEVLEESQVRQDASAAYTAFDTTAASQFSLS